MRDTIKGVVLGALVAAGVTVLLAQSATWTTPRDWATDDLLTAADFNAQLRDNLLWLRQDAQLTGTDALEDLGCGTLGTNEVLFSDCSWATIPAGVVFDIHDDVGTAATIADNDRMVFSDEGSAGDPMRFSTAANIAAYVRGTIPAPPAVTIAALGCMGTPSADTFLRGDCEWAELPTTTVVALDMGDTTTTASTYQTVGPTATLSVSAGQEVTAYISGRILLRPGCTFRVQNTSTSTTLDITTTTGTADRDISGLAAVDTAPSTTTPNTYATQLRLISGSTCTWGTITNNAGFSGLNSRGIIATVTG